MEGIIGTVEARRTATLASWAGSVCDGATSVAHTRYA